MADTIELRLERKYNRLGNILFQGLGLRIILYLSDPMRVPLTMSLHILSVVKSVSKTNTDSFVQVFFITVR